MAHNYKQNHITQSNIYIIPISDNVINAIHHQAQKENMPKSLKITTKYKPWHSIRFAGVSNNENESIKSDSTYSYDTDSSTDNESFLSNDESTKLQEIMESYTPYKDNKKIKSTSTPIPDTWIIIFESNDEEENKENDEKTYASYPELQEELEHSKRHLTKNTIKIKIKIKIIAYLRMNPHLKKSLRRKIMNKIFRKRETTQNSRQIYPCKIYASTNWNKQ